MTPWPPSDTSVQLTGSFGNHILKIDKTVATNTKSLYLRARTRGLIDVYQQIDFVVCPATGGATITPPSEYLPKIKDITYGSEITLPNGSLYYELNYNPSNTAANVPFG